MYHRRAAGVPRAVRTLYTHYCTTLPGRLVRYTGQLLLLLLCYVRGRRRHRTLTTAGEMVSLFARPVRVFSGKSVESPLRRWPDENDVFTRIYLSYIPAYSVF